jgi:hypothetical protein
MTDDEVTQVFSDLRERMAFEADQAAMWTDDSVMPEILKRFARHTLTLIEVHNGMLSHHSLCQWLPEWPCPEVQAVIDYWENV